MTNTLKIDHVKGQIIMDRTFAKLSMDSVIYTSFSSSSNQFIAEYQKVA